MLLTNGVVAPFYSGVPLACACRSSSSQFSVLRLPAKIAREISLSRTWLHRKPVFPSSAFTYSFLQALGDLLLGMSAPHALSPCSIPSGCFCSPLKQHYVIILTHLDRVVTGEIFPLKVRAKALSMTTATNWLLNWAIAYSTPYLVNYGPGNVSTILNPFPRLLRI